MQADNKIPSTFMVVLAFAIVYVVWGSTYFFIKEAMDGFPPLLLGAFRFIFAGSIMLLWGLVKGEKLFILKNIRNSAISGILLLFIGTGAVIWVEQYLPTSLVAILVSSSPIWFVLLDKPKWAQNFKSKSTIAGLVIGFIGIILLFGEKLITTMASVGNHPEISGMIILVVGSIGWAAGSLYSKYKTNEGSGIVNSGWQMFAAGIAFLPGSFFLGEPQHLQWENIPLNAWLCVLYLILFGSLAGFNAYVWLLKVQPATHVSTHAYVNPVVAVLLGVFFEAEKISALQIVGLIIILFSVLMINLVKYRKERLAEQAANDNILPVKPQLKV